RVIRSYTGLPENSQISSVKISHLTSRRRIFFAPFTSLHRCNMLITPCNTLIYGTFNLLQRFITTIYYNDLLQRFITSLYSNLVLFGSDSWASSNSSTETFLIHTTDGFIWASRISIGKDRTSTRFIFRMLKNNVFILFPSFIDTLVISKFFISSLIKSRAAVCFFTILSAALNSSDMSKLIKSSTRCSNRSIFLEW
ncbi:hypothetical protein DFS34DRAFT_672728, partial [Phlyctochytrium arcticum]